MSTITNSNISSANDKQLVTDNQMLTSELIVLNRDLTKLKSEVKQKTEMLKKSDADKQAIKTQLQAKENGLEKVKKERDEIWNIVNTDKYKSFKDTCGEKEKYDEQV